MNAVILYRIDQAKKMHRFYRLDVQPELFGAWRLMREWGRIGSAGQTCSVPFPSSQEAHVALDRQRRAKERRGYQPSFTIVGEGATSSSGNSPCVAEPLSL